MREKENTTVSSPPRKDNSSSPFSNSTLKDASKGARDGIVDILQTGAIIGLALLLRWCISYHPYSGAGKPPMYGDYEAQRHWQEITLNLPVTKWYHNCSENNLDYWGLDYPPVSAYHSLLVAKVAKEIDPNSVKLHQSRGYESKAHKYFMRLSVLVIDMLIFIPAVVYFSYVSLSLLDGKVRKQQDKSDKREFFLFKKRHFVLATILFYPGLMLIDYGHFQYNCVSLGLFIASVSALLQGSMATGSFFFVLALNYKQMELYHSLPCFFYILGINTPGRKTLLTCVRTLIYVSLTVIITFTIIWAPFLTDRKIFFEALMRLFPLKRGIFEDKVANIWCTINVFYKLRNNLTHLQLAQICLVSTTIALLPSSLDLFFRPSREKFLLALTNSSLSFFLFSFQVHEKSILLAAIPVLLHFHKDPFACFWFLIISVFSMLPLFIKDDLYMAYFASITFFVGIISWMWFDSKLGQTIVKSKEEKPEDKQLLKKVKSKKGLDIWAICELHMNTLYGLSLLGVFILSVCSIILKVPKRYPDLFPLLISVYSCGHFCLFLIYFNYKQFCASIMPSRKCKHK